jgi:hypothetical protein
LRYLDGVGQAIAEVVTKAGREDLSFAFHAAKSTAVDNAIAVALKLVSVRVSGFRKTTAARTVCIEAQATEHQGVLT